MRELFAQGGWVLIAIVCVSFVAWMLITWKWLEIIREKRIGSGWVQDALDKLRHGRWESAVEICSRRNGTLSRVLLFGLRGESTQRSFEKHYLPYIEAESAALRSHLGVIGMAAAMLPLFGLLGTVIGMIKTFSAIMQYGTSDPAILAEGISQALVTTKAGLAAALPIILMHGWLSSQITRFIDNSVLYAKMIYSDLKRA